MLALKHALLSVLHVPFCRMKRLNKGSGERLLTAAAYLLNENHHLEKQLESCVNLRLSSKQANTPLSNHQWDTSNKCPSSSLNFSILIP